jgi:hypothetical protein
MRWIFHFAPAMALLAALPAVAQSPSTLTIRRIAEATALGEYCVHWSIDPAVVADFLHRKKIPVDGHYRDIFGAAYSKAHADGGQGGNFPAACDRAIGLYGPQGCVIGGLVRPVWHGTCDDCRRSPVVVCP